MSNSRLPRWVACLATALIVGLGSPVDASPKPEGYRLGFGDALTVTVVGQPTLSTADQPVRPDGRISLPLVREVAIAGKTVSEVVADLKKAYRPFVSEPEIVVTVARFRPVKVTVLGQVGRPGTFDFHTAPTLVDALATAGGLTDRAARATIKVVAPGGGTVVYDLDGLLGGKHALPRLPEGAIVEVSEVWGPDFYRVVPVVASVITAGALLVRYAW